MANDIMTLHCEVADAAAVDSNTAIEVTIRDVTKLRGQVQFVAHGTLPNDGKVIEDARKYE